MTHFRILNYRILHNFWKYIHILVLKHWIQLYKINLKKTSGELVRTELNLHCLGVGLEPLHHREAANGPDIELDTVTGSHQGYSGAFGEAEVAAAAKSCAPQTCKRTRGSAQGRFFLMQVKWTLHLSETLLLHFAARNAPLGIMRTRVLGVAFRKNVFHFNFLIQCFIYL